MITRIDAVNYRCFERLSVPLSDFCILAGANGSGKTTLLDVPVLLGDLLRSRNVAAAFMERTLERGARAASLTELPFSGRGDGFSLAIEARLPDRLCASQATTEPASHIRYGLHLKIEDSRRLIVQEERLVLLDAGAGEARERRPILHRSADSAVIFRAEGPGAVAHTAQVDNTLTALARLQYESEGDYPAGRWLLDLLLNGVTFFDPQWSDLRKASPPGLPRRLMESGQNLPWLALHLQQNDPERFSAWVAHVRTALPQVTTISLREREEDHHAYFRVRYEGGYEVTSSGLSEGTLRILALTLLAYLEEVPALLVVEEPENSIHPQAIDTTMQSLRSLYDRQIWVSTHSPVVLASGQPSELLISRMDRSGAASAIPGDEHPRLARWRGAIDLGSLFAAGVFE